MVEVKLVEGRFSTCTFDDQFSVAEVASMRSDTRLGAFKARARALLGDNP